MLKADNEELEIIEEIEYENKELKRVEILEEQAMVELSINSVVGLTNPGTTKVKRKIRDREVVILVDYGATQNFMSEKLVGELQIATKETAHYGVIMGSGTSIKGKGICEAVEVMVKEWKIVANFLPIELGGVDVVLGVTIVILQTRCERL